MAAFTTQHDSFAIMSQELSQHPAVPRHARLSPLSRALVRNIYAFKMMLRAYHMGDIIISDEPFLIVFKFQVCPLMVSSS